MVATDPGLAQRLRPATAKSGRLACQLCLALALAWPGFAARADIPKGKTAIFKSRLLFRTAPGGGGVIKNKHCRDLGGKWKYLENDAAAQISGAEPSAMQL